jgi:hypothetical protein
MFEFEKFSHLRTVLILKNVHIWELFEFKK